MPYNYTVHKVKWHCCGQIQCAGLNMTSELVYSHIDHKEPYLAVSVRTVARLY